MAKLLGGKRLPTAIFAANDFMRLLLRLVSRVPRGVAVVDFDDGALATVVHPPLTGASSRDGGRVLARKLLRLLRERSATLTVRSPYSCVSSSG